MGYTVASSCDDEEGLCEEGMHIGGLYCCGGGGYTGQYFNGTIDEIRVWTRPLLRTELAQRMYVPLAPAEHEALLLYFPLDDAGMEMGANAVESRALQWCAPRPARRLGPLAIVDASRLA